MIWSDSQWLKEGATIVEGFDPKRVQPNSYELSLGNSLYVFKDLFTEKNIGIKDKDHEKFLEKRDLKAGESFFILPRECVLINVQEYIKVPNNVNMQVAGKSSVARKFVLIHVTAGFIDSGYEGKLTLELVNLSPVTISCKPGDIVAQLVAYHVSGEVITPYGSPVLGSHYQKDTEATPSRS